MYKDKYIYPAIFDYDEDGINVTFPDLPGCITCGADDEEAFDMSRECMGYFILDIEEEKEVLPKATKLYDIKTDKNQRVVLIEVWMPTLRKAMNNKSVKKNTNYPILVRQYGKRRSYTESF